MLLAAVIGERTGRLWHSGIATAPAAAAIDLGPTILQLAGLPVSADLPGESLLGKREDTAKSWDIARWSVPDPEGSTVTRRPPAGTIARQALAARRDRAATLDARWLDSDRRGALATLRERVGLGAGEPDWEAALSAAQALVELHGREIDLWRVAFAAFQGDRAAGARSGGIPASSRTRRQPRDATSSASCERISATGTRRVVRSCRASDPDAAIDRRPLRREARPRRDRPQGPGASRRAGHRDPRRSHRAGEHPASAWRGCASGRRSRRHRPRRREPGSASHASGPLPCRRRPPRAGDLASRATSSAVALRRRGADAAGSDRPRRRVIDE